MKRIILAIGLGAILSVAALSLVSASRVDVESKEDCILRANNKYYDTIKEQGSGGMGVYALDPSEWQAIEDARQVDIKEC